MERFRIYRFLVLANSLITLMLVVTAVGQGILSRGRDSVLPQPKSSSSGCPADAGSSAPPDVPQPQDFVELQRLPRYTVRIRADGQVDWTGGRTNGNGPVTAHVSASQARALIDRLRTTGFWSLCDRYAYPATDGQTAITTLHVGDHEKHVSDYFNGGPPVLLEFEYAIDSLADTHRWIHGDPPKELFVNVRADGIGPKPGLTELMHAASVADIEEMHRLLAAKSDPNTPDSSGWTALVYAAQGEKRGVVDTATYTSGVESVKTLLDSGADPNVRSFMGQTPLMAAVTAYYSPVDKAKLLIAAGADLNAQDQNGHTALMDIITGSLGRNGSGDYARQAELISMLVAAGAFTDLRDSAGLTVFDILEQELQRWTAPSQPPVFVQAVKMQYDQLLKALHR